MNVTEFGLKFNLNVNYDISGGTSLQMNFTRPDGTTFSGVPTVGLVDLVTDDAGTFTAKKYAIYTIAANDLTLPGQYSVRLVYLVGTTVRLISQPYGFTIDP